MATITLNYDNNNKLAKKALDVVMSLGVFVLEKKEQKKTGIELSFEDIKNGRVTRVDNIDNLYEECLK